MSKHTPRNVVAAAVFLIGLLAVVWVASGYVMGGALNNGLALSMTVAIAGVYVLGAFELRQYRQATCTLAHALADIPQPMVDLPAWLGRIHAGLQNPVRLRIEGERTALPGPALTPYLVGLLVMLGMLGTFLGMVVTFKGAVFALEGSADLAAIRAALAEPIKGLSLSFGTSVAGVAASAMLGLLSAISRRERLEAVRLLDARIGSVLRPFSAAYQREETFKALQTQAQALPLIADRLQAVVDGLAERTEQLSARLLDQQTQFQGEASAAYKELARSVGAALESSLAASGRLAGEAIKPVVESAMAGIAQAAGSTQQQLIDGTQAQLQGLSAQWAETADAVSRSWADTAQGVSRAWAQAADRQAQANEALQQGLSQSLQAFTQRFAEQADSLLASVQAGTQQAHARQAEADAQRLAGWAATMTETGQALAAQWQRAGTETLAQQQATCEALEAASAQITDRASQHVGQTLEGLAQLLSQSEAMVQSRVDAEAQWVASQGERMTQLAEVWRSELTALREQEAARGQAAVASLEGLQASVAQHLAQLGTALEAPMTRLLNTAAEVPQAAASVITQLRQEMARLGEEGNATLAERKEMMTELGSLLRAINQAALEQRSAIDGLVSSATAVLTQAGERFADALGAQAGQVDEVAARVAASAVELGSLGEAFHHGVDLFSSSNEKLMDSLQRIESAIGQSLSRSDEQLAYYVTQAREVIDLSISAQQGIVEDLRRLHTQAPASAAVAAVGGA